MFIDHIISIEKMTEIDSRMESFKSTIENYLVQGVGEERLDAEVAVLLHEEDADPLLKKSALVLKTAKEILTSDEKVPPERVSTVMGLTYLAEHNAAEFLLQVGKRDIHTTHPVFLHQLDNKMYFDVDKKEWVHHPEPKYPWKPSGDGNFVLFSRTPRTSSSLQELQQEKSYLLHLLSKGQEVYDRYSCPENIKITPWLDYVERLLKYKSEERAIEILEGRAQVETRKSQQGLRYAENARLEKEAQQRVRLQLESSQIPFFTERLAFLADIQRNGAAKPLAGPVGLLAETHLNRLLELAQTYVRKVKVADFAPWELETLEQALETGSQDLLRHASPTRVSEAAACAILNAGADLLRDLQGYIKGELREIRRDQAITKLVQDVEEINRYTQEAVRTLKSIDVNVRVLRDEVADGFRRVDSALHQGFSAVNEGLRYNFLGIAALGQVMSSFYVDGDFSYRGGGLFGGGRGHGHISGGTRVSFGEAFQHLLQRNSLPQ